MVREKEFGLLRGVLLERVALHRENVQRRGREAARSDLLAEMESLVEADKPTAVRLLLAALDLLAEEPKGPQGGGAVQRGH